MEGIIVDTSSILFAISNKIDIFREVSSQLGLEPVISSGIVRELRSKASGRSRAKAQAGAALELIKRYKVRTEPDLGYVDRWILGNALRIGSVCTNDSRLRRELRSNGAEVHAISRSGEIR